MSSSSLGAVMSVQSCKEQERKAMRKVVNAIAHDGGIKMRAEADLRMIDWDTDAEASEDSGPGVAVTEDLIRRNKVAGPLY